MTSVERLFSYYYSLHVIAKQILYEKEVFCFDLSELERLIMVPTSSTEKVYSFCDIITVSGTSYDGLEDIGKEE